MTCIFKPLFHYEPCRSCNGLNNYCRNYREAYSRQDFLSSLADNSHPQTKPNVVINSEKDFSHTIATGNRQGEKDKTADDTHNWRGFINQIRRYNDYGAI
jgi:hypothetical protein